MVTVDHGEQAIQADHDKDWIEADALKHQGG
jgi:hypothetical protein